MVRDPHPRSAHRANPGGGLAILTGPTLQALTRTAPPAQHRRPTIPAQRRRTPGTPNPTPHRRTATRSAPRLQALLQIAGTARPLAHLQTFFRSARAAPPTARLLAFLRAAGAAHPLAGRHAPPPSLPRPLRHVPPEPQQALHFILSSLGALIVLSIVALTVFFVIAEESRDPVADASAATPVSPESISSRQVDAVPLTREEVFPGASITAAAGSTPYRLITAETDRNCAAATTGGLGPLLAEHGCSQVVRARLTAPYGDYEVTAGIFNLTDAETATRAGDRAGAMVEAGTGTFASLTPASGSPVTRLAQMNWQSQGHYLLYCAISRPDGALVPDDDPYASRIAADIFSHLTDDVLTERATTRP